MYARSHKPISENTTDLGPISSSQINLPSTLMGD